MLNLEPHELMLVAAHNSDLAAAAKVGLRTAFVVRPDERPGQKIDLAASQDWDVVTSSFHGVADAMGVPLLPGHP
jgi:2-haloacid dehalogenase